MRRKKTAKKIDKESAVTDKTPRKSDKKRKDISPLAEEGVETSRTGQSDQDKTQCTESSSNVSADFTHQAQKRIHFSSSPEQYQHFPQDLSYNQLQCAYSNMATNYPPYNTPYMQSPPFTPHMTNTQQATRPQWASDMMQEMMKELKKTNEDLKQIKEKVSKIDVIEKTVNKISLSVHDLENKVSDLGTRLTDVETSNSFLSSKYDDAKKSLECAVKNVENVESKCTEIKETFKEYQEKSKQLEEKLSDLESRSLRENLLFYGFEEKNGENCETMVKTFIKDTLKIEEEVELDRVHRIGAKRGSNTRPIVAKFHRYTTREIVRTTARAKQDQLKQQNLGVGIQQPKLVLEKRRELQPIRQREINAGKSVKWAGAKLLVKSGSSDRFVEVNE